MITVYYNTHEVCMVSFGFAMHLKLFQPLGKFTITQLIVMHALDMIFEDTYMYYIYTCVTLPHTKNILEPFSSQMYSAIRFCKPGYNINLQTESIPNMYEHKII